MIDIILKKLLKRFKMKKKIIELGEQEIVELSDNVIDDRNRKKEVYCKNCKYISEGSAFCNHRNELVVQRPAYDNMKISWTSIDRKNKRNDCKDYKRKWYKFWVK